MHSQDLISVTFMNRLSSDISHTLLYENEEIFGQLMKSGLKKLRKGSNLILFVTTESELYKIRHITQTPLFIKF